MLQQKYAFYMHCSKQVKLSLHNKHIPNLSDKKGKGKKLKENIFRPLSFTICFESKPDYAK